jgi:filamentous hemagglutinin family protein
MSSITRASSNNIEGNLTVNNGDVVILSPSKGVVTEDASGDANRVKSADDAGVKTVEVETI